MNSRLSIMSRHTRLYAIAVLAVVLAVVPAAWTRGGVRASEVPWLGPHNSTLRSCQLSGQAVCNPAAKAYFESISPWSHAPAVGAGTISRTQAMRAALTFAETGQTGVAPIASPARAILTTRQELEKLPGNPGVNASADPSRPVWVVTVHADVGIDNLLGNHVVHVYTVVIDAETGWITDGCKGCDTLG